MAVLTVQQALSYLVVGAFWGCTNPLLKRASHGISEVQGGWLAVRACAAWARVAARGRGRRLWGGVHARALTLRLLRRAQELKFLVGRPQWLVAFLLNQCGSLVYYLLLGTAGMRAHPCVCTRMGSRAHAMQAPPLLVVQHCTRVRAFACVRAREGTHAHTHAHSFISSFFSVSTHASLPPSVPLSLPLSLSSSLSLSLLQKYQ